MLFFDKAAKVQQRRVDVGHARKVFRIHGVVQAVGESNVAALKVSMVGTAKVNHSLRKGFIGIRLEGRRPEVLVIAGKVKGIC